jgi:SAM-dependent methyltransferase
MKQIHQQVASEYSEALDESDHARGALARTGSGSFADYAAEDLKHLPGHAVEASFGCGNPLAFSSVQPGQTVLDLGCGAGLDLLLAAEKVGPKGIVIGVDMTDAMLEKAQTNIKASRLTNIQVRKGHVETLPVESSSIDWVVSNCVINLSPEKDKVFAEIARVLKPGGRMVVSDMIAEALPWWVRRSGLFPASCGGGAISEASYLAGLRGAGLDDCQILARQYYEPHQMASVAAGVLPEYLQRATFRGKPIAIDLIANLAKPIAKKIWSARIAARKPASAGAGVGPAYPVC